MLVMNFDSRSTINSSEEMYNSTLLIINFMLGQVSLGASHLHIRISALAQSYKIPIEVSVGQPWDYNPHSHLPRVAMSLRDSDGSSCNSMGWQQRVSTFFQFSLEFSIPLENTAFNNVS